MTIVLYELLVERLLCLANIPSHSIIFSEFVAFPTIQLHFELCGRNIKPQDEQIENRIENEHLFIILLIALLD